MKMVSQQAQRLHQLALSNPLLKAPMAGLIGRILRWHLGSLCTAAQYPQNAIEHGPCLVPGAAAIILATRRAQDRLYHFPLFVCQFPTACHKSLSIQRMASPLS